MNNTSHAEARDRIWQIVQTVNRIIQEGKGYDRLGPYLHDQMVMVQPGLAAQVEGKAACLRLYEDACSHMAIHRLEGSDERIHVQDDTAVVTYRYDCVWDFQGRTFTDDGREIVVVVRDGDDWKIAWRTMIPGSRQVRGAPPKEELRSQKQDVGQVCQELIATSPVCYLTTMDADGLPHTTAMNNLRCAKEYPSLTALYEDADNDFLLYLTTGMQSDKMSRIKANPKACAYVCDAGQITGLLLGGQIEIVTDQAMKRRIWQKGWTLYYPNGPDGPEYAILRLAPTLVKGWWHGRSFDWSIEN